MKKYFLVSLLTLAAMLAGCSWQRPEASHSSDAANYELVILHTNDTHSGYGGLDAEKRICYQNICEGGSGGIIRLKQAVDAIRRDHPNSVLLDAGDQFQGTLFFNIHKEDIPAFALNSLGYDAMCPGNHEFDDGCERFAAFLRKMDPPMLAANLAIQGQVIKPWTILERGGREIGIIGLATPETPALSSPCAEATFSDPVPALRKAVAELTTQGVNIIIVLDHLGLNDDLILAGKVDGVDVIVGGHSHSLLSNSDPKAEGSYPMVKTSPSGQPVLVVTAGHGGAYLGKLNVDFDEKGVPVSWNGGPIPLNAASLAELKVDGPDAIVSEKIREWAESVDDMLEKPLGILIAPGRAPGPFEADVRLCRVEECLSGDITADALKARTGARVALVNGGSIRRSLSSGVVSAGDVLTMLPFANSLMIGTVSGKTLLAALEYGLSGIEDTRGRFLQVAGLRYVFDAARPKGKRLVSAEVLNEDGRWESIKTERSYRVATLDYLARGGDGYVMFKDVEWKSTDEQLSDVVRGYITRHSPLAVKLEKRVTAR